jgi:diaminopimelate epimerase
MVMGAIAFTKYEGLGNDFIVVSLLPEDLAPAQAVQLCDRHRGIGADGVLLVSPGPAGSAARMVVINADGSRPEMCGNGLRCVALHLALNSEGASEFRVETDAGTHHCSVELDGAEAQVVASMGRAELRGSYTHPVSGLEFALISTGNPHAVTFVDRLDDEVIDRVGPEISKGLPGGANVEFVAAAENGFDVVVWERGVGRTQACGTGAVAVVVAAATAGRAQYDQPVRVRLPGGLLHITVRDGSLETVLRGPARRVFAGEYRDA